MEFSTATDVGFLPVGAGDEDDVSKLHKSFLAELKRHENTLELIEQSYAQGQQGGSARISNGEAEVRDSSTSSSVVMGAEMISKLAALSKDGLEKEICGVLKEFDDAVENGIPFDGYVTTGFDGGDFYRGGVVVRIFAQYRSCYRHD